jgi:hypothetical protein
MAQEFFFFFLECLMADMDAQEEQEKLFSRK